MDRFTIRDIENLSGIKAHTLRIWEQRYSIIIPKRKESNHRYYDNEDLKNILRIAYLYNNGYKISKIAKLPVQDLRKLTIADEEESVSPDIYTNRLLEAALDYDEVRYEEILNEAIEKTGFEKCIFSIIYPFLQKVGLLWLSDAAFPSQEHFSSNIIRRKMIAAIDAVEKPSQQEESFLLFTPAGELHEIPLLVMHYLLKKSNRKVYYLGTNISFDALDAFLKVKKATYLHFHLITNLTSTDVNRYAEALSKKFPRNRIIMSGPLTKEISVKPPNLHLLTSLNEKIAFAKNQFQ
jgi:DNA-binding transcriptional MerR regulator